VKMHAAVVTSFDEPPRYRDVDVPQPGEHHELVDVLAVGLHPRVRSGASGKHYTSTGRLPLIPGIDGVGRTTDGSRIYFVADDELPGPMADRAIVDMRRTVPLPGNADAVRIAAVMNPAMSAWMALRRRVPIEAGQSVLVLGATGNAGTMAVQIAKRLGAARVVGAGRDTNRLQMLKGLGVDETVQLAERTEVTAMALGDAAAEVDVVLDYLWGKPAQDAIMALLTARSDRSRALNWIHIGAVAGPMLELPSVALRSANFRIQGVGQGAISTTDYLAELPSLIDEIESGTLRCTVRAMPLRDIESVWSEPAGPGERIVIVP
jgi:NADPH:quinone reductase-like Zn-dependent oxidoreductase